MTRIDRRELMRVGGLTLAGLSLPELLSSTALAAPNQQASFGRAKNIIFLYLNGGPPQHETFDPKPDAPAEIRGVFNPIQTNIPGIHFSELLPRTAALADKLAVVRSMATDDNIHSSSGHWVLTGYKYQGSNARTIQPTDWPYFGSLVSRYRPSEIVPALSSVMVPDMIRLNENVMPAGQTGGLMGSRWTPERFVGDPSRPDYHIEGLELLGVTSNRVRQRRSLLGQLEDRLRDAEHHRSINLFNTYQQQAFDLLTSGRAKKAFAINEEPAKVRDRYGRNRWGQCVLLARRLIESGVRLAHVNWPREPGDNAVDNPLWDTHAQNHDRLEDVLCPIFDVGFSALVEDLDQRGLLDETLVVAIGEFGRTPKINAKSGRDHWGSVFSFVMAGAGISGGQVFGSSDSHGAYPKSNRLEPGHLTATIFHLLGLDHHRTFADPSGRELSFTKQKPIYELLGESSATAARVDSTGDVARVPAFDEARILASSGFDGKSPILPVTSPSRPKGWRSLTPVLVDRDHECGLHLAQPASFNNLQLGQHAAIGFDRREDSAPNDIADKANYLLGQEVRSPFAGTYQLDVEILADGDQAAVHDALLKHFEFRLVYLQFNATSKQFSSVRELASKVFVPTWASAPERLQRVEFVKGFQNPNPGANFSFGLGMAVGIAARRKTSGSVNLPAGRALLRVARVDLKFMGKEVNKDVMV